MRTLGFEESDVESLLLLNRVFRVSEQYLDIKLDLRHAPFIINETGCNTGNKTVSTPREKLQDKWVLDSERVRFERGNTTQTCVHETFLFGPRQVGPCGNSKTFGSEDE